MKYITKLIGQIRSSISKFTSGRALGTSGLLALAAAGSMFSASTAVASNVRLKVSVPGYGEVSLLPGSNTGGRVVLHRNGYYYTDRVARGELLSIEGIHNPRDGECPGTPGVVGYYKNDDAWSIFESKSGPLDLRYTIRVPQDAKFRNMHAFTLSFLPDGCTNPTSWDAIEIPIGTR